VVTAPRGAVVLDRLLRGRGWVACVGVLLAGIVFLNVSVLELNEGIARTSEKVSTLKSDNAALRKTYARLSSTERIQSVAARRGLVLPAPGKVRYLHSDPATDGRRAARRITEPKPQTAPPPEPVKLDKPGTPAPAPVPAQPEGTAPAQPQGTETPPQPTPEQPAPAPEQPAPAAQTAPAEGTG
jgi:cell division protein FtsL